MAKLFITLYLMVIASFGVFIFYVFSIQYIGETIGDGVVIDEEISRGTFNLLNESLEGLGKHQTDNLLQQYKKVFGDEFRLAVVSTFNLNDEQIQQLENGDVVSVEEINIIIDGGVTEEIEDDDVDIVYFKRAGTPLVWRAAKDFNLELSVNESGFSIEVTGDKFLDGMMYLIQAKLLLEEQEKWPIVVKKIEPIFGFPLLIRNAKSINKDLVNKERQLALIKENKAINITQGTDYVTFVKQIPNSSSLLQIGPVEIPWYLRNVSMLFIFAFVMSFATTLFLWLWPLWSNLIKIKKTADDFGSGNYDARISHRKWSPVAKVSKAFNAMAEQTQRSIRSQKELTSAVSHELRTPVARMRFALEMLDASSDKKEKTRYVKDINEDIDELDLLLEELLTYARFDQQDHRVKLSEERLVPWVSQAMGKLMPLAIDRTLNYSVEGIGENETSLFEARLMTSVLDNLVQNALRYAKHTVQVTLSKDYGNYLLIVEDDGFGIPKNKRGHIFDAFSRIDASRDRASGGFGLGLAIVDRIVKAHQGTVSIHDSALGGARFEVRIPVDLNV